MSSVGGTTRFSGYDATNNTFLVHQDLDHDGIVDNNEQVQRLSEQEVNTILASLNSDIVVTNGIFTNTRTHENYGSQLAFTIDAPDLPEPVGSVMDGSSLRDKMVWAEELQDAALMWTTLMTLAESGRLDTFMARKLKHTLQKAKINLKDDEIGYERNRIEAEKKSAALKFGVALASASASFAVGAGSSALSIAKPNSPGIHAISLGMQATAQGAGQVVNTGGDFIDKAVGFQKQANDASIEAKKAQKEQESVEQVIEDTRSNEDDARQAFQAAIKLIEGHIDRQSEIVRKIANL